MLDEVLKHVPMTKEEVSSFWKLGASLQRVPEEASSDLQVLELRAAYEQLKAKMLAELAEQRKTAAGVEEEAEDLDLTPESALAAVGAALTMLATVARQVVPQLFSDQNALKTLRDANAALKWLQGKMDSLSLPSEDPEEKE